MPFSDQARQWALDVQRFHRQEQTQGHVSPTDAAFLTRLQTFLRDTVAASLAPAGAVSQG